MSKTILNNIKAIATKQKITIAEVERRSGLKNGAISKWETSSPTMASLEKVAEGLKCKVTDLLKEK